MNNFSIDIHTHILPENIPHWNEKFGYGGFIQLDHHKNCCARMIRDDGKFFREVEDNCWSAEKRSNAIVTKYLFKYFPLFPSCFPIGQNQMTVSKSPNF